MISRIPIKNMLIQCCISVLRPPRPPRRMGRIMHLSDITVPGITLLSYCTKLQLIVFNVFHYKTLFFLLVYRRLPGWFMWKIKHSKKLWTQQFLIDIFKRIFLVLTIQIGIIHRKIPTGGRQVYIFAIFWYFTCNLNCNLYTCFEQSIW